GLASRVELYLLDEPTSGLDPLMEAEFQRCVHELREEGATILLSSHILAEVEALSDRVSIIRAGRNVQTGTLADLRHLTHTTVLAETDHDGAELAGLDGVHRVRRDGGRLVFEVDDEALQVVLPKLAAMGVRSLQAHPPTLEELFLREYGEDVTT
ncbi:MAG: DUF4162 domain-containing protein, partial [Nocardioides sp.]|nr:DUF4162 domain-containing protein [Nocardioides sp.]